MTTDPMSPQRAAILAVLQKAARPMRLFEIAAATGMKPTNAARLLYAMKEDGQADHAGPRAVRCWVPHGAHHGALPKWRRSPYRHIKGLIATTANHG